MSSSHPNHDPALSSNGPNSSASAAVGGALGGLNGVSTDAAASHIANMDPAQLLSVLKNIPGMFNKFPEGGNLKEQAAQALSNLAQGTQGGFQTLPPMPYQMDPGPSSHPRGPPNLGMSGVGGGPNGGLMGSPPLSAVRAQETEEGASDDDMGNTSGGGGPPATGRGAARRGGRSATMGSDEWSRQRKDNHKEVERRRRGNINDGINELGRIVPNGSGEKAKGAILSRAVQYIHHLKENEARNIEKWTLEKLLMDQAMGDLQSQLEDVRRLWDEERAGRKRAEDELRALRGDPEGDANKEGEEGEGESRTVKRQRVG